MVGNDGNGVVVKRIHDLFGCGGCEEHFPVNLTDHGDTNIKTTIWRGWE